MEDMIRYINHAVKVMNEDMTVISHCKGKVARV